MSQTPLPAVRVKPALTWGWEYDVGHTCSYVCGAGGCAGRGWRPTRAWAVRAGLRYRRSTARMYRRQAQQWEEVSPPKSTWEIR